MLSPRDSQRAQRSQQHRFTGVTLPKTPHPPPSCSRIRETHRVLTPSLGLERPWCGGGHSLSGIWGGRRRWNVTHRSFQGGREGLCPRGLKDSFCPKGSSLPLLWPTLQIPMTGITASSLSDEMHNQAVAQLYRSRAQKPTKETTQSLLQVGECYNSPLKRMNLL